MKPHYRLHVMVGPGAMLWWRIERPDIRHKTRWKLSVASAIRAMRL